MSKRNYSGGGSIGPDHVREGTDTQQAFEILAGLRERVGALEETNRGDESTATLYRDSVESILISDAVPTVETHTGAYEYGTASYDFSTFSGPESAIESGANVGGDGAGVIPDTTPPAAPTLSEDSHDETSVSLTVGAVEDGTKYRVYQNGGRVATLTGAGTVTVRGLAAATTYSYQATALDAAGNESDPSATIEVTTDEGPQKRYISDISSGETVTIESGETAYVDGTLTNDGTLVNDGTLIYE